MLLKREKVNVDTELGKDLDKRKWQGLASLLAKRRKRADELKKKKEEERNFRIKRQKLISSWLDIMAHSNMYNANYDTFRIKKEELHNYGWSFQVYAPTGLSFKKLDNCRDTIQSNLGCTFLCDVHPSNKYADCKVVYTEDINCNKIPFEPVSIKANEICPGVDITGKPIIVDLNAAPHIMIAGQTRRGKNGAADSIILNWINNCTEDEIELYLFQCAKIDLIKYKDCKQVKGFVLGDVEKMVDIMRHVVEDEIARRLEMFTPMFKARKGENIADFNRLYPDRALPYTYVIIDEFVELMLTSKSSKEINDLKKVLLDYIQQLGQMGAAVGMQYMIMHQKPEMKLCPTFIKNMSSVRICFGFDDESCGRVVLGEENGHLVHKMPARRAYALVNGAFELMFTTNLTDKRDMYITPHEVENREDILDKIKKESKLCMPKEINKVDNIEVSDRAISKIDAGSAVLPSRKDRKKNKKDNNRSSVITSVTATTLSCDCIDITGKYDRKRFIGKRVTCLNDLRDEKVSCDNTNIDNKEVIVEEENIEVEDSVVVNNMEIGYKDIEKEVVENIIKEKESSNIDLNIEKESIEEVSEKVECVEEDTYEEDSNVIDIKKGSGNGIVIPNLDMVGNCEIDINKIVEINSKKNANWVPYKPLTGKEKIIKEDDLN